MDNMNERRDTPWLDMPLMLDMDRTYMCMLNDTDQCDYQQGYWRFWYEADHRYGLPTIALFMAVIIVFTIGNIVNHMVPQRTFEKGIGARTRAFLRFLSYRTIRIQPLNWNSAPVGVLMLGALGLIFFLCMTLGPSPYYWPNTDEVNFGESPPLATRAGWMGLACLPFVFATAGKANLITLCTGVSHERLQVFHRWISYAFFVLSLIHTFPFIVYNFQVGTMVEAWNGSIFYWSGVVALVAQAWLTFASWGPFRNWSYEWFKISHFIAATVFVLFFFFHCDATLTSWDYFVATGVLFTLSWLYRYIRTYFEHGISGRADLSIMPNGFVRLAVPTEATWTVGQHYFIRVLSLGVHALTIHPFTACSLPSPDKEHIENGTKLVFFIKPRAGFTCRLAKFAEAHPTRKVGVILDGPYGGVEMSTIRNSHRMLVIAGGSGAGWLLPFVITFLRRTLKGSAKADGGSPLSLRVVLATRHRATVKWFEEEVRQILDSMGVSQCSGLEIELCYTGSVDGDSLSSARESPSAAQDAEKESKEAQVAVGSGASSGAASEERLHEMLRVQHLETRPDLPVEIQVEAASIEEGRNLGVFVCGPLSMQDDVSNAVAREQLRVAKSGAGDISLHMEHFSWA